MCDGGVWFGEAKQRGEEEERVSCVVFGERRGVSLSSYEVFWGEKGIRRVEDLNELLRS